MLPERLGAGRAPLERGRMRLAPLGAIGSLDACRTARGAGRPAAKGRVISRLPLSAGAEDTAFD
jgi:hypothetical protein